MFFTQKNPAIILCCGTGDSHKIKQILPTYIKKIIVYHDKIEAHFRLPVDDTVCGACMVAANRSQL